MDHSPRSNTSLRVALASRIIWTCTFPAALAALVSLPFCPCSQFWPQEHNFSLCWNKMCSFWLCLEVWMNLGDWKSWRFLSRVLPKSCNPRQTGNDQDWCCDCHLPLRIPINSQDCGDEMEKEKECPDTPLAKGRGWRKRYWREKMPSTPYSSLNHGFIPLGLPKATKKWFKGKYNKQTKNCLKYLWTTRHKNIFKYSLGQQLHSMTNSYMKESDSKTSYGVFWWFGLFFKLLKCIIKT